MNSPFISVSDPISGNLLLKWALIRQTSVIAMLVDMCQEYLQNPLGDHGDISDYSDRSVRPYSTVDPLMQPRVPSSDRFGLSPTLTVPLQQRAAREQLSLEQLINKIIRVYDVRRNK